MKDIPVQVLLLAIFGLIVIAAVVFRARISLRVKNWFDLDAKPTTATDVVVGKSINAVGAHIGEAVGVTEQSPGRDVKSISVLEGADAHGATIDRLVGLEQSGGGGVK